MAIPQDRE